PMFATTTKHKPVLAGIPYLRTFLESHPRLPHLAIGGITPENAADLAAAGCRGVAVSSCVCASERPEEVCAALVTALSGARPGSCGASAPRCG
ncbi:MAG: thiamine phosphate synthase, partial [Phycisphaerales bacterium]